MSHPKGAGPQHDQKVLGLPGITQYNEQQTKFCMIKLDERKIFTGSTMTPAPGNFFVTRSSLQSYC